MSLPTFKRFLMKLGKSAVEHKVASILLLEIAKSLPASQLAGKHYSGALIPINHLSVSNSFSVLTRITEYLEPKINGIARLINIIIKSFVGFLPTS